MKGVFCPVAGAVTWANETKDDAKHGGPRCTRCGNHHSVAKGHSVMAFEEPTRGKKKHFKKGKKTR